MSSYTLQHHTTDVLITTENNIILCIVCPVLSCARVCGILSSSPHAQGRPVSLTNLLFPSLLLSLAAAVPDTAPSPGAAGDTAPAVRAAVTRAEGTPTAP